MLEFLSYWRKVRRGVAPTLVFDSRFTTYPKLSQLNAAHVKFITLRRRGDKMIKGVDNLTDWQRIHIPHAKRKFPNPLVHDSTISLPGSPRECVDGEWVVESTCGFACVGGACTGVCRPDDNRCEDADTEEGCDTQGQ